MPNQNAIDADRAEREEFEFIAAARGIVVREQCYRCHREVATTQSGACDDCAGLPT